MITRHGELGITLLIRKPCLSNKCKITFMISFSGKVRRWLYLMVQSRALSGPSYRSSFDSTRTASHAGVRASHKYIAVSTKLGSYRGCLVAVKILNHSHHHVEVHTSELSSRVSVTFLPVCASSASGIIVKSSTLSPHSSYLNPDAVKKFQA